jgi:hypothetical protein
VEIEVDDMVLVNKRGTALEEMIASLFITLQTHDSCTESLVCETGV